MAAKKISDWIFGPGTNRIKHCRKITATGLGSTLRLYARLCTVADRVLLNNLFQGYVITSPGHN